MMGGVLLIIIAALFIDTYGYTYRFLVEHKGLGQKLTSDPHIGGLPVFIHKGLDLSGGTELTIAICQGFNNPPGTSCRNGPPKNSSPSDVQNGTITVLQQRVNSLGVAEASVQAQGSDQVLVQIPGVGLAQAQRVLGTTARLHFATSAVGNADPNDPTFIADQQRLFDPRQLANTTDYPPGYHWKIDDNIAATDVTKADVGFSTTQNAYAVDITFNSSGAAEWLKITTDAVKQTYGTPPNRVAIFLDNTIISAPNVQQASSNQTEITGNFTADSATQLASSISAGALPAEIATVQANEVSATLGQDTVRKSLIAGLVGLIIVVLFMIGYYRFPGVLASVALLFYA
ncbi:MAG: preprotein translocase subunit SecD, partial [Candidatus Dormibacteria bacterium]